MFRFDVRRYEEEVVILEQKEKSIGRILFYGNSYFAYWSDGDLEEAFSNIQKQKPVTINNGFGGSTSAELLYYYPRLVKPYAPSALVWCEGANDFWLGYTPAVAFQVAKEVFEKALMDLPDIVLILLSAIETPRAKECNEIGLNREYNQFLKEYAKDHENCFYIDIAPFFYEGGKVDGEFREIFRADMAHLTKQGYELCANF